MTDEMAVPVLRLVRGNATPEELAAVVALLSRAGTGAAAPAEPTPPLWARPQLRAPLRPGPGAWRGAVRLS